MSDNKIIRRENFSGHTLKVEVTTNLEENPDGTKEKSYSFKCYIDNKLVDQPSRIRFDNTFTRIAFEKIWGDFRENYINAYMDHFKKEIEKMR